MYYKRKKKRNNYKKRKNFKLKKRGARLAMRGGIRL